MESAALTIRPATAKDVPLILHFIRRLAEYERLAHEVTATEDVLRETLFGRRPSAEVILGYLGPQPVGFALFFHNFSTFLGRPGIYLEDLFIEEDYRRRGFGRAMLRHLARLALERNCGRLEWWVLDWNRPAIDFYRRIGAVPMSDWTVYRLSGAALQRLAE
ncbi:MAG: GNAT family N-acetyltransferase [Acidobacteria bacterium]|nr:GNAT family N-acetyltransferase [Acidobacteriota bacterium]